MPNLGLVVADTVLPSSVRAAVALAVDVRGWADRSELCVVAASVVVLVEDTDEADSDWCDCNARRLEGGPLVITMGRGTAVVDEAELDAVDVVVRTVGLVFLRFLFLNDICTTRSSSRFGIGEGFTVYGRICLVLRSSGLGGGMGVTQAIYHHLFTGSQANFHSPASG